MMYVSNINEMCININTGVLILDLTYDRIKKLEQSINGLNFSCIARVRNLGVVHLAMDNYQNICWPHCGECTILVEVLIMNLLVVDMLNVFFMVSGVRFAFYGMHIPKTFIFLTSCAFGKLVLGTFQDVLYKQLVFLSCSTQKKKMGGQLVFFPTSFKSARMFFHFALVGKTIWTTFSSNVKVLVMWSIASAKQTMIVDNVAAICSVAFLGFFIWKLPWNWEW